MTQNIERGRFQLPLGRFDLFKLGHSAYADRFFPPKHIKEVGTFQDSGPLENDPIQTAFSEVKALFPLIRQPDFLVSLGTGGSRSEASNISTDALSWTWRMRTVPRLWRMFEEKMRDRTIKDAFLSHPKYHRLDLELEDSEPRLDDVGSISELQTKAQEDESLSTVIDNVARCAIASLFYFEFDSTPKKLDNTFTASGRILCVLQPNDPSFRVLFAKLANDSSGFYIDNQPISGRLDDQSIFGLDGSFRLLVELRLNEKIAIYLKQPGSNPCNISGSPFSVNNVISAQGLDAFFGRSDHRKRKRLADTHITPRKKR